MQYFAVVFSEPFVIFSGGMPNDPTICSSALTIMHGKKTTVLEMEHNVVDFITLCSTPYENGKPLAVSTLPKI